MKHGFQINITFKDLTIDQIKDILGQVESLQMYSYQENKYKPTPFTIDTNSWNQKEAVVIEPITPSVSIGPITPAHE